MPSADGAGAPPSFRHRGDVVRFTGWRISLVEAAFTAPDGTDFTRDVVRHPGAVAVVPVTDHGTALLVRQYRGAVDQWLLEIPAGTRDVEGEAPERTAGRELTEEVGVRAGRLRWLGTMLNTPGFCDERTELYLATSLTPAEPARHGEEERFITVEEVALDEVDALQRRGELVDAQTILGLLLARQALAADRSDDVGGVEDVDGGDRR